MIYQACCRVGILHMLNRRELKHREHEIPSMLSSRHTPLVKQKRIEASWTWNTKHVVNMYQACCRVGILHLLNRSKLKHREHEIPSMLSCRHTPLVKQKRIEASCEHEIPSMNMKYQACCSVGILHLLNRSELKHREHEIPSMLSCRHTPLVKQKQIEASWTWNTKHVVV